MYIVSKERGIILNFDNIVELFGSEDAILAKQPDGKIIPLQSYESTKELEVAILIIANELKRNNVVYIPNKETIKGYIVNNELMQERHHNIKGKKTKGHGGS